MPVIALLAGLMVFSAGPAAAASRCTVNVPSRLGVNSSLERFRSTVSSNCAHAGMSFASWNIRDPSFGTSDIFIFESGRRSDTWRFYAWEPLGTYYVEPWSAWDSSAQRLAQNNRRTSVRLASRVSIRATRAGRFVTLSSTATRYQPSDSGFRPWTGRRLALSYRTCRTCSWHHIATRITDGRGNIRPRRVLAPTAREFRAHTADMSTTWGRTSAPLRR